MKRLPIILAALLLTAVHHPVFAKRRASRQEWIQRKEDLKPEQLRKLVEENHQLKFSQRQLIEELDISQQELENLLKLRAKINALRKRKGIPKSLWDNKKYKDLDKLFIIEPQGNQGSAEENEQLRLDIQKLVEEVSLTRQELKELLRLKNKINALRKRKGIPKSSWDNKKYTDLDKLFTTDQQGDPGLAEENEQLRLDIQKLVEEVSLTRQELKELLRLKNKINALRKRKGIPKSLWDNKKYKDLDKLFTTDQQGDPGLAEENEQLRLDVQKLVEEVSLTRKELKELLGLKTKINALRKRKGIPKSSWDNNRYKDLDALFASGQEVKVVGFDGLGQDDWAIDANGRPYIKGIIFKVQIGAYRKRDLSNVLEKKHAQEAFEQEQTKDINQYTLRHFRNYWKANKFKKELRAMGLKDAWIVVFKDGKRVPIKAVLKEINLQKK